MARTSTPHLLTNPNCVVVDQLERPLPRHIRKRLEAVRREAANKKDVAKARRQWATGKIST